LWTPTHGGRTALALPGATSSNPVLLSGGGDEMSKVLIKSAWGSDDPTKAAFPFLHGNALAEKGHEVQIFLLGEAVSVMRDAVAHSIVPVGWPPLATTFAVTVSGGIPIHV